MIDAFEAHLRDDPDDQATWNAYADYLTDQGDPRGEFMAVQLALERADLPAQERIRLKGREATLLGDRDHWLGPALSSAIEETKPPHSDIVTLTYRRGWLQGLSLDFYDHGVTRGRVMEAIVAAPATRWVLGLTIYPADRTDISPLVDAPFLPVLRKLHLGGSETNSYADRMLGVETILEHAPRLESVALCMKEPDDAALFAADLPRLREIVIGCAWRFATDVLAQNASLRNLRTLRLVPGYSEDEAALHRAHLEDIARAPHLVSLRHLRFSLSDAGDAGIDVLVRSGLLHRLEVLDLSYGNVTDAGAHALAHALTSRPHRLRLLNLSDNALTAAGVAELRALGLDLSVDAQHEAGDTSYLFNGNME